jgi:hypothetical protein
MSIGRINSAPALTPKPRADGSTQLVKAPALGGGDTFERMSPPSLLVGSSPLQRRVDELTAEVERLKEEVDGASDGGGTDDFIRGIFGDDLEAGELGLAEALGPAAATPSLAADPADEPSASTTDSVGPAVDDRKSVR